MFGSFLIDRPPNKIDPYYDRFCGENVIWEMTILLILGLYLQEENNQAAKHGSVQRLAGFHGRGW